MDSGKIRSLEICEGLQLRGLSRKRIHGEFLITLTLVNVKKIDEAKDLAGSCFYQVSFSVRDASGRKIFRKYVVNSQRGSIGINREDESINLLYRKFPKFAIGHGCSADWQGDGSLVQTVNIPVEKLPTILPVSAEDEKLRKSLSMEYLGRMNATILEVTASDEFPYGWEEVVLELSELSELYSNWIADRNKEIESLDSSMQSIAVLNMNNCLEALHRIQIGIELLQRNPLAARAFSLANRVMLMQQVHYGLSKGINQSEIPSNYTSDWDNRKGYWRSFQLAFILSNIVAFVDDKDSKSNRDTTDLIWFPTGGGKTEAYLGLAAFAIIARRLINPENSGCTVLMRYTLRLLTAQQLQRAAAMICACEYIRRRSPQCMGEDPISIGLWIGGKPNKRSDALRMLKEFTDHTEGNSDNPFQLLVCPWCGAALNRARRCGYRRSRKGSTVIYRCPRAGCEFSNPEPTGNLPVFIIDEDIYENPPSLLLATVDKFANLAWKPESSSIFGLSENSHTDPPDLIIQDELHLISGPLGSMVGLYEAVIDYLCSYSKSRPKVIASTATIRRAKDQCLALYDREKTIQFPPQGLDICDSFFAKESKEQPGRMYIGIFPSAASSPQTALRWVSGALLQGALSAELPVELRDEDRDAYWTLVQYFSSLRELGAAKTLARSDIREHLEYIGKIRNLEKKQYRRLYSVEEMTGRRSRGDLYELLGELDLSFKGDNQSRQSKPVDILLATNMISVGVDIPRLGLMTVVGQPKTTSEYIQASSRVGRDRKSPGVIVMLYNASKSRDRSHYEDFKNYHQAFYSHVEPTSVTPFSIPAMERGLHALLIIALRLAGKLHLPSDFRSDMKTIESLRDWLGNRVKRSDPDHLSTMLRMYDTCVSDWEQNKGSFEERWGNQYWGNGRQIEPPRMLPRGKEPPEEWRGLSWAVLQSMRSVDVECNCRVIAGYSGRRNNGI